MKKEQEAVNSAPVEELSDKFSKDSIMRSKRFAHRRDALSFLLKDGDAYTMDEVERILNNYMKGVVR